MRANRQQWIWLGVLGACGSPEPVREQRPAPGVVFTYPAHQQRDVPTGARLLVSYSDAEAAAGQNIMLVGPGGPIDTQLAVVAEGKTLAITPSELAPATSYELRIGEAPLLQFTTRNDRPRAGLPALVAFNGSDPAAPGSFRPIFDASTIQLVFSEPLDPRSVALEPGAIELVDAATGTAVPATLLAQGIHVAIDPVGPLAAAATYEVRLGDRLVDLGGDPVAPIAVPFVPLDSTGRGAIAQRYRTRQAGDPLATMSRAALANVVELSHPLIGTTSAVMHPNVIETELGDPAALGGPIAFRVPRGVRLASQGLDIALAGVIPAGLTTGDIWIEMLTDGGGRLYRNAHQPPETLPDNERSPLLVDVSFDLAIYASDPAGNAVLAQTALGVQLTGHALADDGTLAIETLGALDIGLLGMASAPTNIVLDLISDPSATPTVDSTPPLLLATSTDTALAVDDGIELVFDEPIDIARARAGGIRLRAGNGDEVASSLELHGSVVVVRPRESLANGATYRVELTEIADARGNVGVAESFDIATQLLVQSDVPASPVAVQPGVACALVDADATSAGRCAGGAPTDDRYRPFTLAANERITVAFDQPLRASSLQLGRACDAGSVRVERTDDAGTCLEPVPGTLVRHRRDFAFVPDAPWTVGERYRLRVISGPDSACSVGEICGANGRAVSFDPLAGATSTNGGGPELYTTFVGVAATRQTTLFAGADPSVDLNGSGHVEAGERHHDDNRVALQIVSASGLIQSASFVEPDCVPATPAHDSCMYMLGTMPAALGDRRDNCALPDGSIVATCIPVSVSAQAMYSTSMAMQTKLAIFNIPLTSHTGMSVMRVREPRDGQPLEGYIVDRGGVPVMVVALDLYMDAPDMAVPLSQHDMKSKPLSVALEGPLTFGADGRIAIALHNLEAVPVTVGISAPLGLTGAISLVIPAGEMKLQLMSRSQRGSLP